jgi:hypothetical protein
MFSDITGYSRVYFLPFGTSPFIQFRFGPDVEMFVLPVCACEKLQLPTTNATSGRRVT